MFINGCIYWSGGEHEKERGMFSSIPFCSRLAPACCWARNRAAALPARLAIRRGLRFPAPPCSNHTETNTIARLTTNETGTSRPTC